MDCTLTEAPTQAPPAPLRPFERRDVLRAAVDLATPAQIIEHLTQCADEHRGCSVVGISAPYATAMARDEAVRAAFLSADILIPDGKGFVWGARFLNVPCAERFAVPDLCDSMLKIGAAHKWKVFIYGSTAELNARALENIRARYPGLAAVEGQHGYDQGALEEDALIAKLRDERFNLLIVARPSPDKEKFLARCCPQAGIVGLAAGGYVDILAGEKKRAPRWIQALGMEWAYRVAQDPLKLWKRIGWANVRFAASVLWRKVFPLKPWFAQPLLHVVLIVTALVLAYSRSLNAPYHYDDPEFIQHNEGIRSLDAVSSITVTAHRKAWWYSYAICYKLSEAFGNHKVDKPDVRIFRLWNIACHLIATLALYGLLRRCLRAVRDGTQGPSVFEDVCPFAAAALFAAHPLATESVTYISGRNNGMGGMFYLLGLYFSAVTFKRLAPENTAAESRPHWPRWFWPSMLAFAFGMLAIETKESHNTFFVAVPLVYVCFFRKSNLLTLSLGMLAGVMAALAILGWGLVLRNDGALWIALPWAAAALVLGALSGAPAAPGRERTGFLRALPRRRIGSLWGFVLAVLGLGVVAIFSSDYVYTRTLGALTGYQGSSPIRSLCTQAYALPWMLLRCIAPVEITFSPGFNLSHSLNIDHDFPTITSFSDPRAFGGAMIIAALALIGVIGVFRGWLMSFGILLALLTIAPSNSIIERGDVVSERNFYLAAAGGACVLAAFVGTLGGWLGKLAAHSGKVHSDEIVDVARLRRVRIAESGLWSVLLSCCIAGPFVSLTILRNNDWNDPYRLWESARAHSPYKMRVLYNFAMSALSLRRSQEAEAALISAIKIGSARAEKGDFRPDEAVDVKCFHYAYARLAEIYIDRYQRSKVENNKSLQDIREIYEKGLNRTAYDPDLAVAFAMFLDGIGQTAESAHMLQVSYNHHLGDTQLYFPLGLGDLEAGDYANAATYLELALKVRDESTLGLMRSQGDEQLARIQATLGVARVRLKDFPAARIAFREALRLDPEALLPVIIGFNSAHNLKLTPVQSNDGFITAISMLRHDILTILAESSKELLATHDPKLAPNLGEYVKVFNEELQRRDEYLRKRREFGFKDEVEDDN